MMFRTLILIFFCSTIYSQNPFWDSVSMGFPSWSPPGNLFVDTFQNKAVVFGSFKHFNSSVYNNIFLYDGINADSLNNGTDGNFQNGGNSLFSVCSYKGKLYVGGAFLTADHKPISRLAVWDGSSWDSLPSGFPDGTVTELVIYNGELYIIGTFNKIGNLPAEGFAKWDGTTLTPFTGIPYYLHYTYSSAVYNGELYLGGNNYCSGVPDCDIVKYDGVNWSVPGGGLLGSASWVNDLEVYNNKLYVGGYFTKSEGNAGSFLMTWDGLQFNKVFDNIDDYVWSLEPYNGKLLVGGCFQNVNGIYTGNLISIDSNTYCTLGSQISQCITDIQTFGSTFLISGGFIQIDTDTFNCLAQWGGGSYTDTCNYTVGLKEADINSNEISIYPNPATNILNVSFTNSGNQSINMTVFNTLGEIVINKNLGKMQGELSYPANISELTGGIYFLKVQIGEKSITKKFIKQ
jgi:hypothetical protein